MEECKAGKDQDTKNVGEGNCFYGLVKERTKKGPVRMAIYGSGEDPLDTVIENGVITLDGEELTRQESRRFVARHRADLERLLFEDAKANTGEKEYRRDLQVASIADKAGDKGTWARIAIREGGKEKVLLIGRDGDAPAFMIDGEKAGKEEAVHLIRDNYEQFDTGLHKAEMELRSHYRGRKEAGRKLSYTIVSPEDGKVRVNLRKVLPEKGKTSPELKNVRKITAKHFGQMHIRSHLKD